MQRRRSARLAAAPLASSDASSPSPSTPARGGRASVAGRAKGSKGAAAATMAAGGAWVTVADVVLLGAMLLYLFLCPYNKVGAFVYVCVCVHCVERCNWE